ncbi:vitamin-D-receptor interacting mediator subunit 4-domain-containing protein [Flagelloscypha sp. PMI_526]|nr:vitamin-D-receptor interacting mediator subunit 4-domain-containing protein [Flagelloscypha sp. PMI_526]
MSDILLNPLNDLQDLSQTLFHALSPSHTRPPPVPSLHLFAEVDQALCAAINLAHTHQVKQKRIEQLKKDILELDARWKEICEELYRGKVELEEMLEEGDTRIKAMSQAKEAAIPYPDLLSYAQSLSAFTSAPPNMPDSTLPGQPPPPLFFPPFPNEEKMRRGRLNAEAPLGPLGETHSVKLPSPSPQILHEQHYHGANPYVLDQDAARHDVFELELDLNEDLADQPPAETKAT